jgi:hypothetical protein
MVDLTCRSFDVEAGTCGEPVAAQVPASFLYGGFPNPMNSLFDVTQHVSLLPSHGGGDAVVLGEVPHRRVLRERPALPGRGHQPGYALRVPGAHDRLSRRHDQPTQLLVGIQTAQFCYDLEVTPTSEHVLVGTFDVSERADKAACGQKLSENHPVALIPIAGSGSTFCTYEVVSSGACTRGTLAAGTNVCLPCDGTCPTFANKIGILFDIDGSSYGQCQDVEVKLVSGSTCSTTCTAVKAIGAG